MKLESERSERSTIQVCESEDDTGYKECRRQQPACGFYVLQRRDGRKAHEWHDVTEVHRCPEGELHETAETGE